ncbi:MAG TPA: IPT/TIG domain-containing protein [Blastocatellia bacterium]|nr:IPT/TIG domain-containing protein [Blastocatellia bacterium]
MMKKSTLRALGGLLLVAAGLASASAVLAQQGGTTRYVYDENGRLKAVISPAGEAAVYEYDPAGNLLGVTRHSANVVSIIDFTPKQGGVGATVTIYGTGFSPTASATTVSFNGIAAMVVSADATQIVTRVPAGATTGTITVTAPNGTAASGIPFTVADPPIISDFTPLTGSPGAVITIGGAGFVSQIPSEIEVAFNGAQAEVLTTSFGSLKVRVPAGATSGPISVTNLNGQGVSSSAFILTSPELNPASVESISRIGFGETRTVTISSSGNAGILYFDGSAGQRISAVSSNGTISLYGPSGNFLTQSIDFRFLDAFTLQQAGIHHLLISQTATVTLYNVPPDAAAAATAGGPAVPLTTTAPGQNARLSFTASELRQYRIEATNPGSTPLPVHLSYLKPDGSLLTFRIPTQFGDITTTTFQQQIEVTNQTSLFVPELTADGIWTVLVDFDGPALADLRLRPVDVTAILANVITPDGTSRFAFRNNPGEKYRATFAGTAGQRLVLNARNSQPWPQGITVFNPDGSVLLSQSVPAAPGGSGISQALIEFPPLPTAGDYVIVFVPPRDQYTNLFYELFDSLGPAVPIGVNGPELTVSNQSPGRNVRLIFDGSAGQQISLGYQALNGVLTPPSRVSVLSPGGQSITDFNVTQFGGQTELLTLPVTGTYTILLDPAGANLDRMTFRLIAPLPDVTAAIAINGPPVTITTAPEQNARLTFDGSTGQRVSLRLTEISSFDSSDIRVSILRPDGTVLAGPVVPDDYSPTGTLAGPFDLPVTGTYTILFDPQNPVTGSLTFTLMKRSTENLL